MNLGVGVGMTEDSHRYLDRERVGQVGQLETVAVDGERRRDRRRVERPGSGSPPRRAPRRVERIAILWFASRSNVVESTTPPASSMPCCSASRAHLLRHREAAGRLGGRHVVVGRHVVEAADRDTQHRLALGRALGRSVGAPDERDGRSATGS
jgi:hypothetical protein